MMQNGHMQHFSQLEQAILTGGVAARLLTACLLGGAIGLDREYRRKASGVRTNMLICFGAALFTFLSPIVAGELSSNKAQVASNIVQGIGFLGAGLILHNRDQISGLTSAATVFAVASIGMACGAGLYFPAIFASVVVLVGIEAIGWIEHNTNLKVYSRIYEVRGTDAREVEAAILHAMDTDKRHLGEFQSSCFGNIHRYWFAVIATTGGHKRLSALLQASEAIETVFTFAGSEDD